MQALLKEMQQQEVIIADFEWNVEIKPAHTDYQKYNINIIAKAIKMYKHE